MSIVRFNEDHEWVRLDGDEAVVGITDYAQTQLGEVVHVDLPPVGKRVEQGKEVAAVESVKVSNAINAPISGEVTVINAALRQRSTPIQWERAGSSSSVSRIQRSSMHCWTRRHTGSSSTLSRLRIPDMLCATAPGRGLPGTAFTNAGPD